MRFPVKIAANIPVKKALYFSVPVLLGMLVFFQAFSPFASSSNATKGAVVSQKLNRKVAADSGAITKVAPKTESGEVDLKKIPDGIYYSFVAGYTCDHGTEANPKLMPSHADSYTLNKGVVCHTGDACADIKNECFVKLPYGMEISKDKEYSKLNFNRKEYRRQESVIPEACMMPMCGIPDDNCRFADMPPLDGLGCPMGCGTVNCKPNTPGKVCPDLSCAAPPQNCNYDGKAPLGKDGCPLGCGNLVCDSISRTEFKCNKVTCAKPPENCRWDNSGSIDENGCKTTCGQIVCDVVNTVRNNQCPAPPKCAEPPAGCNYVGEPTRDKFGCRIGCGSMSCTKKYPNTCKPPVCKPPAEFCRYDGNSPLDFNGCLTGCGNTICNSPEKK